MRVGTFWLICLKVITPIVLGYSLINAFLDMIAEGYEGYPAWALIVAGAASAAMIILISFVLMKMRGKGDVD